MSDGSNGMFRQKSLERLSSPERLDQLLTIVDRKSWIPLVTLASLIAAALVWAIAGRVPIHVEGKGMLVRPRGIVELHAPGAGRLQEVKVAVGDDVRRGQELAKLSRPDLETQLELQRQKQAQLADLAQSAEILREGGPGAAREIATYRERELGLADTIRKSEAQALELERQDVERQLEQARRLQEGRLRRLEAQRALLGKGVIDEGPVLDAEEAWLDAVARVSALEVQLRGIETRKLEVDQRHLDRARRVVDFALQLQNYEQQAAEVAREIERLRSALEQETLVIAESAGRVLELSAAPGEFLTPGSRIGSLEVARGDAPLGAVVYFAVRDGKRIAAGVNPLHERILVTPDTVERQRFGGIVGRVLRVEPFPVTLDEAERQIGNRAVAEELLAAGYRIQVTASLTPGPGPGGFTWSSSRGPDIEISSGTTTTARIAVEERTPITFVLPFLREAMGLD